MARLTRPPQSHCHITPDPQWGEHLYCQSITDFLPASDRPFKKTGLREALLWPLGQPCPMRCSQGFEGKERLPGLVGTGHNFPGAPRALGMGCSCCPGRHAWVVPAPVNLRVCCPR